MMHRSRILTSIIILALLVCGGATSVTSAEPTQPKSEQRNPTGAAAKSEPSWYSQAISQGRAGLNVTNFWSLGSRLRAETVVGGHKIITIVSGDTYYAFDALVMSGVAIERSKAALAGDVADRRPFGNELETMLAQGAEKVREEVVLGTMCDVYQVTDEAGRRMLWVSKGEWELPVRIEIYNRKTSERKHTDFLDWSSGVPIEEVFFVPDSAVVFERYTLEAYVTHTQTVGPVGSVPVLYADLLHGRRRK